MVTLDLSYLIERSVTNGLGYSLSSERYRRDNDIILQKKLLLMDKDCGNVSLGVFNRFNLKLSELTEFFDDISNYPESLNTPDKIYRLIGFNDYMTKNFIIEKYKNFS